uniref:Uncharacterized protein n=1 Tax=Ixodes scapularis TaxID=6945 RepID=A0A4D5S140_IXOSC
MNNRDVDIYFLLIKWSKFRFAILVSFLVFPGLRLALSCDQIDIDTELGGGILFVVGFGDVFWRSRQLQI